MISQDYEMHSTGYLTLYRGSIRRHLVAKTCTKSKDIQRSKEPKTRVFNWSPGGQKQYYWKEFFTMQSRPFKVL